MCVTAMGPMGCAGGRGIVTAPKPAKLIAKGLLGVSFWVQVLLKKFEWAQPLQRTVCELRAHGLEVSPGTLSGGLRRPRIWWCRCGALCATQPGRFALAYG